MKNAILFFYLLIVEFLTWLVVVISLPFRTSQWRSQGNKTPILFIHGYLHNSSAWVYLWKRLEKAQWGPLYAIDLGSPVQSIEQYAQRVQEKARHIARETKRNDLILIGHSMGGLVSAFYALKLAPKGSVKAVITLGSPFYGTRMAPLGIGKCAKEMRRNSQFLVELVQSIGQQTQIPFLHIGTRIDFMIIPSNSAYVCQGRSTCIEIPHLGHLSLLYSNRVFNEIYSCLLINAETGRRRE